MMKSRKFNSIFLFVGLALLMGIGVACSEDDGVEPKAFDEYKSELSEIVSYNKDAVGNTVVGYEEGDFKVSQEALFDTISTRYMDSLLRGEAILEDPESTIDSMVYANWAITEPGYDFWNNIYISDRTPLQEAIVSCDTFRVRNDTGYAVDQYPPEADSIFLVAIDEARYWRDLNTTIDSQVASEVDSLNAAREIYEATIIK